MSSLHAKLLSVAWGIGLVAIFGSWSLVDATAHGKSRNVALAFTAAWFIVFFFAVFPYLFVTRGAKTGALASLRFLSLCLGCGVVWLFVPFVVHRM
jgi:hypothetical protein